MKNFRFVCVVSCAFMLFFLLTSSSFASSSPYDFIYNVSRDTVLMSVPTYPDSGVGSPSASYNYYFQNGSLYLRNGSFNSPFNGNFSSVLNEYGLATISDILTYSLSSTDLESALKLHFGTSSFPYTIPIRTNGLAGTQSRTVISLPAFQFRILQCLIDTLFLPDNYSYLTSGGTVETSDVNQNFSVVLGQGFSGLSRNLVGYNGFTLFSRVLGSGSQSTSVYSVLQGLSLLDSDLTSLLVRAGMSDQLLADGTEGEVLNDDIPGILSQSTRGLATILRGSPGNVATFSILDYKDLSSNETFEANNILDAIVGPFGMLQNQFATFLYSHGTDLDVEMRENMQQQADAFVDQFTSSSGSGTPSADNIGDTAGVSGAIKDSFSGDSTTSDAFTSLTDSESYSFLSSDTQRQLNPYFSETRSITGEEEYIDFVSPHLDAIFGGLGSSW